MPKPTKGPRLGGSPSHERIILANLARQLFEHGRIQTTETKARRLRPLAEKLITKAKRGDLHSRRLVVATIRDKGVVHTLFTEIAPKLADRDGGYVRITKLGNRKGDNAPMALIEVITESVEESRARREKAGKATGAKAKKSDVAAVEEAAEVEVEETAAETSADEASPATGSAADGDPELPQEAEAEMVGEGAPVEEGAADTTVEAEEKPEKA